MSTPQYRRLIEDQPQWSPAVEAGKRDDLVVGLDAAEHAAMEPGR